MGLPGFIPPGGVLGASANTMAGRAALMGTGMRGRTSGRASRTRRASSGRSSSTGRAKRSKKRAGKRAHLVAGSAAAKAWGRKMKRLRGRR